MNRHCEVTEQSLYCAGDGGVGTPHVALADQTEKGSDVVDDVMLARGAGVNDISYEAFCAARAGLLVALLCWLKTEPAEAICTRELMATQSAIRQMHDAVTGRITLNNVVESAA